MKCNPFTNTSVLMLPYGSHLVRNVQASIRNVPFEMAIKIFFLLILSRKIIVTEKTEKIIEGVYREQDIKKSIECFFKTMKIIL